MSKETESLFAEVLVELLKFLKRENERQSHQELEQKLAEYRNRRWGYPIPRRRRS